MILSASALRKKRWKLGNKCRVIIRDEIASGIDQRKWQAYLSNELIIPTNHLILCCPFSSCLQSFSGSGSFPMIWLFTSGGQSTGASASASILPMNIQGWFPLGLTGLISLLSKGLSRVVSRITVQKHQLFSTQSSLWSNSHICTSGKEPSCQCRRCKTCRFDPWVRKIP